MNTHRELTQEKLNKTAWQAKYRREYTDSPECDFAENVRKSLIQAGLFQPLDPALANTPEGRRTPLTPTDSFSDRSATPSPFLK